PAEVKLQRKPKKKKKIIKMRVGVISSPISAISCHGVKQNQQANDWGQKKTNKQTKTKVSAGKRPIP
ncbi:hypothetical protein ACQP3J_33565, partial [Escherichia coli]